MVAKKQYAQRDTAIDGKHFAAGDEVKDVSTEELGKAVRAGFAGPDKPSAEPDGEPGDSEKGK